MVNGMVSKIQKAKRYAQERHRIQIDAITVKFDGENNPHTVQYEQGNWQCDCNFFLMRGRCSHTMALEIILEDMIKEPVAE